MTDKMTLDDLIAELESWTMKETSYNEYIPGYNKALEEVDDYIQSHRPALEAGMRMTLRFEWLSYKDGYEDEYECSGVRLPEYGTFHTKQDCQQFAQSLGMTAEFVEESDE